MNGEEDEHSLFGMEKSKSIYTIPYNLKFHHIKLDNFLKFYYSIEIE